MSDSDTAARCTPTSTSAASSILQDSTVAIKSPDTSVSSSTTSALSSPVLTITSSTLSVTNIPATSTKTRIDDTEVTSTSCIEKEDAWNLTSLDSALVEKNPLSLISEEDMFQLQSVLSTEEGKKILEETSLPPEMNNSPTVSDTEQPQNVTMETKSNEASMEGDVDIPLELDDETASQILKEGIRESYLVDFAVSLSDHAYSAQTNMASYSTQEIDEELSAVPMESSEEHLDPAEMSQDYDQSDSQAEGKSPSSHARNIIRRSTRIQDQEQREMAEKIRQENIQAEKDALSQEEETKGDPKKYNMRTKRPQRDDGRVDYTIRRGKKKIDEEQEAEEEEQEDEEDNENEEEVKSEGGSTPRRSARSPKKKQWLLELEKERDSRGEDSGRDSGKATAKAERELSEEEEEDDDDSGSNIDDNEEESGKSEGSGSGPMMSVKQGVKTYSRTVKTVTDIQEAPQKDLSPAQADDVEDDSEPEEPAPLHAGRGRGRGGRGVGRGRRPVKQADCASSGSERESSRSRSGSARRGRGSKGGKTAAMKGRKIQPSDGDSTLGQTAKRIRKKVVRSKRPTIGKQELEESEESDEEEGSKPAHQGKTNTKHSKGKKYNSDNSEESDSDSPKKQKSKAAKGGKDSKKHGKKKDLPEESVDSDSEESEVEVKTKKLIKPAKRSKVAKQKVKTGSKVKGKKVSSEDDASSDSSEDDLPLTMIQKVVTPKKGKGSTKAGRSVSKQDSDAESGSDSEGLAMVMSSDEKPLKAKRKKKVAAKTKGSPSDRQPILQSIAQERDAQKKRARRRVRGHKEENPEVISSDSDKDSEDSEDSNWDSDDDPEKLWCICRKPYNNRFMISCDKCLEWFHGTCVGVTRKQGKNIAKKHDKWSCPSCLAGAKKSRKTKSRMKSKDSCKDSNPDEESQEMEVENQELDESPDKAHVSMETDDEQLAMDFMSDENKPLKSHKVKSHGDVKTKRARSTTVAVAEQSNVKGSHEELKESPDKGQGDGQGEGYDESEEPDEAMEDDASDDDTWSVRKKDSERKLEAMQEKSKFLQGVKDSKLKALKAKKDRKDERKAEKSRQKPTSSTVMEDKKSKSRDHLPKSLKERCIRTGCHSSSMSGSVYCGEDCIAKYADESLDILQNERERNYGSRSVESPSDRMVVMERRTGKIVTGPAAPTEATLHLWLEKHPSFEVLRPEKHVIKRKEEKKPESLKRDLLSLKEKERKLTEAIALRDKLSRDQERQRKERRDKERRDKERRVREHERRDQEKREQEKREQERREYDRRERERRELERKKIEREEKSPPASSGPNPVRISVRKALKDYLSNRANDADDIMLSNSEIKRVALDTEEQLFRFYGEVSSKYKHKFKHILVNIKDVKNKGLFRRILHGELSSHSLVRMSSEQLSSKEMAHWQEPDTLHDLDLLGVDESPTKESSSPQSPKHSPTAAISQPPHISSHVPPLPKKPLTPDEKKPKYDPGSDFFSSFMFDTTAQHKNHLFDVNCKICTGKISAPEPEETSDPSKKVKFSGTVHARAIPPTEESQSPMKMKFEHEVAPVMDVKTEEEEEEEVLIMEADDDSPDEDDFNGKSKEIIDQEVAKETLNYEPPGATTKMDVEKPVPVVAKHGSLPPGALVRKASSKSTANQQAVSSTNTPDYASSGVGHSSLTGGQLPGATPDTLHPDSSSHSGTSKPPPEVPKPGTSHPGTSHSRSTHGGHEATRVSTGHHQTSAVPEHKAQRPSSLPTASPNMADSSQPSKPKHRFAPSPHGLSMVWKGHLFAQDLPKFYTAAYVISGSGHGLKEDLPETISIMGRLPPENVFDYLARLKGSHASNREICVLKFVPTLDEEKKCYIQLYNYLNGRNRCGVVGALGRVIKDLYIVPLPAHAQVPKVLMPFEGPGLEFPRPHMLLCIIVKAKSRRHHGAKDASKDTESGRTWMYSERSAGEAAKVKGQGDQPMLPHQTTLPTSIPPMSVKIQSKPDPRLAAAAAAAQQQQKQQLVTGHSISQPQPTNISTMSSSQEAVQSPHTSTSSEDSQFSGSNANDPIVKHYAKAKAKKLDTRHITPGSDAYDPASVDYLMPYGGDQTPIDPASLSDAKVTTSGYPMTMGVPPPLPSNIEKPPLPVGPPTMETTTMGAIPSTGISQLGTILEELTKKKSSTDMKAAVLATLAASSASQSIQEQRNLLMELNKKVEEQRLILERQREEALKRNQDSISNAASGYSLSNVMASSTMQAPSTVEAPEGPKGVTESPIVSEPSTKEQLSAQTSVLDSEIVSMKLNLARRRLAQKQGTSIPPVSSEPAIVPAVATLPPTLQSLMGGPSLESLKRIMSTVTTSHVVETTKQETAPPHEWDELEAALNDPGGRTKAIAKDIFKTPVSQTDEDMDYRYEGSRFDPDADQYIPKERGEDPIKAEQIVGCRGNEKDNVSDNIPGFAQDKSDFDKNSQNKSQMSVQPELETGSAKRQAPAWLLQIRQNMIDKGRIKVDPKDTDSEKSAAIKVAKSPPQEILIVEDDRQRRHDRTRGRERDYQISRHDRRDWHNTPRRKTDEDLEEGEIAEQFSPAAVKWTSDQTGATSQGALPQNAAKLQLEKIPLPIGIPLPPTVVESKNITSTFGVETDSNVDKLVKVDKKSSSPRRRVRSRTRSRDRRRRSRSRDRRRRSRSRNRRMRSRSRDRSRRSRRSRSRDRKHRSRSKDTNDKRSQSKDRNTASKRKRSISKEKNIPKNDSAKTMEKKPKVSPDSQPLEEKVKIDKCLLDIAMPPVDKLEKVKPMAALVVMKANEKTATDSLKSETVEKGATPSRWKAVPEVNADETNKLKDTDSRNVAHSDPFQGNDSPFALAKDVCNKNILSPKEERVDNLPMKKEDVDYRRLGQNSGGTQMLSSVTASVPSSSSISTPNVPSTAFLSGNKRIKIQPLLPGLSDSIRKPLEGPSHDPTITRGVSRERDHAGVRSYPRHGNENPKDTFSVNTNRQEHEDSKPNIISSKKPEIKSIFDLEFPDRERGRGSPSDVIIEKREAGQFAGRPRPGPGSSPSEISQSENRQRTHILGRVPPADIPSLSNRDRSEFDRKSTAVRTDHHVPKRDSESQHMDPKHRDHFGDDFQRPLRREYQDDSFQGPPHRDPDPNSFQGPTYNMDVQDEIHPTPFRRIPSNDRIRPSNFPPFRGGRGNRGNGPRPPFPPGPRPPFINQESDSSTGTLQQRRPHLLQNPDGAPSGKQRPPQEFKPSLLGPGPEDQAVHTEEPDDIEMAPVPEPWCEWDKGHTEPISQDTQFSTTENSDNFYDGGENRSHGILEPETRHQPKKSENPFDKLFDTPRFSKYTDPSRMKNPELPVPSLLGVGPDHLYQDKLSSHDDYPSHPPLHGSNAERFLGRGHGPPQDSRRGIGRGLRGHGPHFTDKQHGWIHGESRSDSRSDSRPKVHEDSSRGPPKKEEPQRTRDIGKTESAPSQGATDRNIATDPKTTNIPKEEIILKDKAKSAAGSRIEPTKTGPLSSVKASPASTESSLKPKDSTQSLTGSTSKIIPSLGKSVVPESKSSSKLTPMTPEFPQSDPLTQKAAESTAKLLPPKVKPLQPVSKTMPKVTSEETVQKSTALTSLEPISQSCQQKDEIISTKMPQLNVGHSSEAKRPCQSTANSSHPIEIKRSRLEEPKQVHNVSTPWRASDDFGAKNIPNLGKETTEVQSSNTKLMNSDKKSTPASDNSLKTTITPITASKSSGATSLPPITPIISKVPNTPIPSDKTTPKDIGKKTTTEKDSMVRIAKPFTGIQSKSAFFGKTCKTTQSTTPARSSVTKPGITNQSKPSPVPSSDTKSDNIKLSKTTPDSSTVMKPDITKQSKPSPVPSSDTKSDNIKLSKTTPAPSTVMKPDNTKQSKPSPVPSSDIKSDNIKLSKTTPDSSTVMKPDNTKQSKPTTVPSSLVMPGNAKQTKPVICPSGVMKPDKAIQSKPISSSSCVDSKSDTKMTTLLLATEVTKTEPNSSGGSLRQHTNKQAANSATSNTGQISKTKSAPVHDEKTNMPTPVETITPPRAQHSTNKIWNIIDSRKLAHKKPLIGEFPVSKSGGAKPPTLSTSRQASDYRDTFLDATKRPSLLGDGPDGTQSLEDDDVRRRQGEQRSHNRRHEDRRSDNWKTDNRRADERRSHGQEQGDGIHDERRPHRMVDDRRSHRQDPGNQRLAERRPHGKELDDGRPHSKERHLEPHGRRPDESQRPDHHRHWPEEHSNTGQHTPKHHEKRSDMRREARNIKENSNKPVPPRELGWMPAATVDHGDHDDRTYPDEADIRHIVGHGHDIDDSHKICDDKFHHDPHRNDDYHLHEPHWDDAHQEQGDSTHAIWPAEKHEHYVHQEQDDRTHVIWPVEDHEVEHHWQTDHEHSLSHDVHQEEQGDGTHVIWPVEDHEQHWQTDHEHVLSHEGESSWSEHYHDSSMDHPSDAHVGAPRGASRGIPRGAYRGNSREMRPHRPSRGVPRGAPSNQPRGLPRGAPSNQPRGMLRGRGRGSHGPTIFNPENKSSGNWALFMPRGDEKAGFLETDDQRVVQHHSPSTHEEWDEGHMEEHEPQVNEGWDQSNVPLFHRGSSRGRAMSRGRGSGPPSILSLNTRGRPPFRGRRGRW